VAQTGPFPFITSPLTDSSALDHGTQTSLLWSTTIYQRSRILWKLDPYHTKFHKGRKGVLKVLFSLPNMGHAVVQTIRPSDLPFRQEFRNFLGLQEGPRITLGIKITEADVLAQNQDANDAARGDLIGATRASHQEAEPGGFPQLVHSGLAFSWGFVGFLLFVASTHHQYRSKNQFPSRLCLWFLSCSISWS
jgi:hypothetical protein